LQAAVSLEGTHVNEIVIAKQKKKKQRKRKRKEAISDSGQMFLSNTPRQRREKQKDQEIGVCR